MDPRSDPTYGRLFDEYSRALKGYNNAIESRRRIRNNLTVKRSPVLQALNQFYRRPVGSSKNFRIPSEAPSRTPNTPQRPKERRIYLGDILGYAKIIYTPSITPGKEPDVSSELEKLYGRTSQHIYWNAKAHYERRKKTLLEYSHRGRTKEVLAHGTSLQILGVEKDDVLVEAQREVEAGCVKTWNLYKSSRTPKSEAVISILLESLADANFVGLESHTVKSMSQELSNMILSNKIKMEQ